MKFAIGAYPRSGTAWLSTMLNLHSGVMCSHDALEWVELPYKDIHSRFANYESVGDSSSSCCLIDWPDDVVRIYIHRHRDPVTASMDALGMADDAFIASLAICDEWAKTARYHIHFDDIFAGTDKQRLLICESILSVCAPGIIFDRDKVLNLLRHNVKLNRCEPSMYDHEAINRRLSL